MGFSGGIWTPPSLPGSWSPAISGQAATPTDWNTLLTAIAAGLSTMICRDGQSTVTADIPFAGFRLKGVGAGVLATDAANVGQVQAAAGFYAADTGTATAYVITPTPAIAAYAVGLRFSFKASHTNTGSSPTFAVSALTAGAIQWPNGDPIGPGDIILNGIYTVFVSDAATPIFQLQGRSANIGDIKASGNATADDGWLLLFGQSLLRSTYAGLFAKYGTAYGSADGTHFNVPDLRGRIPAGLDNMGGSAASRLTVTTMTPDGVTLGAVGGEQTHTLITAEMPAHTHTGGASAGSTTPSTGGGAVQGFNSISTGSTGGDGAHNNVQPTFLITYQVKT